VRALFHLQQRSTSHFLNLGNGTGVSIREIIRVVEIISGKQVPNIFSERRSGDPSTLIADASSSKNILKWQTRYTDINIIVETALNWIKNKIYDFIFSIFKI